MNGLWSHLDDMDVRHSVGKPTIQTTMIHSDQNAN